MTSKDLVKLDSVATPILAKSKKRPAIPNVTSTNENRDQPNDMKTYATANQTRVEVTRSFTPSHERRGLPNQFSTTLKSVPNSQLVRRTSNFATYSIALRTKRKSAIPIGINVLELKPIITNTKKSIEIGNDKNRYRISRSL
jgi:hypothetical protein